MDSLTTLEHKMSENRDDDRTQCAMVIIECCPSLPENGQTSAAEELLKTGIQEESLFSGDASCVVDLKELLPISPTGVVRDENQGDKGWAPKDAPCAEPVQGQETAVLEQTKVVETSDGTGLASTKDAKTRRRGWWNPLRWLCGANKGKKTKRPGKYYTTGTRPHVGIEDHCSMEFTCDTPQTEDKPHSEQDQDQNVSCPASEGGPETTQMLLGENLTVSDGDAAVEQPAKASSIAEDDCIEMLLQELVSELPPVNVVETHETQIESCAALLGDGIGTVEQPIMAAVTDLSGHDRTEMASTVKEQKIRHRSWWNPFSWLCPGKKSCKTTHIKPKKAKRSKKPVKHMPVSWIKPTVEKPVEPASLSPVEVGMNMSEQTGITLDEDRAVTKYRNESCPEAHSDDGTTINLEGMTTDQTASPTLSCAEDGDGEKLMQKPVEGGENCAP